MCAYYRFSYLIFNLFYYKETMNIYVGNLARTVSEDTLRKLFESFGQVTSIRIIKDKFSGEAKGFGFVDMANADEAQKAIAQLNGAELEGQQLKVNEARPPRQFGNGGDRRGGPRGPHRGGSGSGYGPRRPRFNSIRSGGDRFGSGSGYGEGSDE
jgi:RNA recognition motif-containing protein